MPKSIVDEILKDQVKVMTVSRGHYFVQVLGKPTQSCAKKSDAEMRQAEWLTALSGLVVRTAMRCSKMVGDDHPRAGSMILDAVAEPLADLPEQGDDSCPLDIGLRGKL